MCRIAGRYAPTEPRRGGLPTLRTRRIIKHRSPDDRARGSAKVLEALDGKAALSRHDKRRQCPFLLRGRLGKVPFYTLGGRYPLGGSEKKPDIDDRGASGLFIRSQAVEGGMVEGRASAETRQR